MTRASIIAKDYEYTEKGEQLMDTLIAGIRSDDARRKLIAKHQDT